jgi:hypothetical protein
MLGEVGDEFIVGDATGLGKAVHAFVDLDINVPIVDEG